MTTDVLRYFLNDDRFWAARWGKQGKIHVTQPAESITLCGMWNREKLIDLEPDSQGCAVFDETDLCQHCKDVLDNSGITVTFASLRISEEKEIPELTDERLKEIADDCADWYIEFADLMSAESVFVGPGQFHGKKATQGMLTTWITPKALARGYKPLDLVYVGALLSDLGQQLDSAQSIANILTDMGGRI